MSLANEKAIRLTAQGEAPHRRARRRDCGSVGHSPRAGGTGSAGAFRSPPFPARRAVHRRRRQSADRRRVYRARHARPLLGARHSPAHRGQGKLRHHRTPPDAGTDHLSAVLSSLPAPLRHDRNGDGGSQASCAPSTDCGSCAYRPTGRCAERIPARELFSEPELKWEAVVESARPP